MKILYIAPNVSGLNSFFVTGELVDEGMPSFAKPLEHLIKNQDKITILVYPHYCNTIKNHIVSKNNLIGCQFHPEKSGKKGLELISNFLNLTA